MHLFSPLPLSLLLALLDPVCQVHAVRFPFQVRTTISPRSNSQNRLFRRTSIPVANTHNAQYISNLTIAGQQVRVMLDTGSSDLWVNFPNTVPQTTDTGKSLTLNYAVGAASGNIRTADMSFNTFSVSNQAFLLVQDTSTFSGDIHAQGYDGLIGFGPNTASSIKKKLKGDQGDTLLTNIFQQNPSGQHYISILLDRKGDPSDPFTGQMTLSEVVPGFENITTMPKMDVEKVSRLLKSDQHWQVLTDKDNGIIGPDGQVIKIKSIVPKAPSGQLVAVVDSGFTFTQVPRELADAIYGRVQGAIYDTKNELWNIPCGQYLNITFNLGGISYPVHPLDTVNSDFGSTDANGNAICVGTFQPITTAFSLLGNYDMILGMSFLRNAYTLMDFGDWIDGVSSQDDPYIQMLPLTTYPGGKSDFVNIRLGSTDTTSDAKWALLPADQMQHSPVSKEEKRKKYQEMILSRWPYILVGCLVLVLLIIGCFVWRCCCYRRKAKGLFKKAGKVEQTNSPYLPLQKQGGKAEAMHSGGMESPYPYAGGR